jgi:hypothetical protein
MKEIKAIIQPFLHPMRLVAQAESAHSRQDAPDRTPSSSDVPLHALSPGAVHVCHCSGRNRLDALLTRLVALAVLA